MSINAWLPALLELISRERDVSSQNVKFALEDCIADCYYHHFRQDVSIRIGTDGTIVAWFDVYNYQKILDVRRIPRKIIKQVKKKLPEYIQEMESDRRYSYWRQFRYTAREGIIVRTSPQQIDVEMGDQTGYMLKMHAVQNDTYIPGQAMQFFVLKVSKKGHLFLSRASKSLPEALLSQGMPWGSFRCTKRLPGIKSHIKTDINLQNKNILRDVSRELNEVITWEIDGSISRCASIAQVV